MMFELGKIARACLALNHSTMPGRKAFVRNITP